MIQQSSIGGTLLVHGALHGAWCWERVVPLLDHAALAVTLPGRGDGSALLSDLRLSDFVDAAAEAFDATGWDSVVIVAHSMGGVTACGLAARLPGKVRHMVFVSCVVPPEGRSASDAMPWALRVFIQKRFHAALARGEGVGLSARAARFVFCNDLDPADASYVLGRLCREAPRIALDPVSGASIPPHVPRTWVRLLRDRAIRPRRQDVMIANLGGADVVEINAGHDVMVSRPADLARVINRVAEGRRS